MALVLLALPGAAQAWSAFGHRLVAEMAEQQLSADAREQLKALLPESTDLAGIAAWADQVRKQPAYQHTAPWHYINFVSGQCRHDARRDCEGSRCIIAALESRIEILADHRHPLAERQEALRFVVHLIGDLHQPLHNTNRDDRGGNRFQIRVNGEGSNLHAVWDYHLLRSAGRGMRAWIEHLQPRVARERVARMDIAAWSEQSCRLIDAEKLYPARPGKLPAGYFEQQLPVAEHQLVRASARLAAVLESALGP